MVDSVECVRPRVRPAHLNAMSNDAPIPTTKELELELLLSERDEQLAILTVSHT